MSFFFRVEWNEDGVDESSGGNSNLRFFACDVLFSLGVAFVIEEGSLSLAVTVSCADLCACPSFAVL